jgi:hypothetical protein
MAHALPELRGLLPEHNRDEATGTAGILDILRSQPLRTQANSLTSALASGSGADLIASFGYPYDAYAGAVGVAGMQAFLRSLKSIPKKQ